MDAEAGSTLLRQTRQGGGVVVQLRGELDLACRDRLTRELDDVLDRMLDGMVDGAAGATLQLDLSAVTFLDATTLGVLARAVTRARARGSTIEVVHLQQFHRRIFEIAPCGSVVVEE